ncbi:hypothetical protein BJ138DRAFT_1018886 [Hygrophoropsis aurantiaca]|uniref:Uncharacterized protein n=1 Tax=Hygrophoropsis aurantiaca TaxID=72124 RepID=A0ACB7ZVD2_9AGAM|nr:hypothetical protein BJ138DRAFT_1018886 [Hygrophoropsis aurantiaca]
MSTTSYSFQSPSVTLEKGAYRMRAPRSTNPHANANASTSRPTPLRQFNTNISATNLLGTTQTQKLVLIALLTIASLASFGTAYYLFTSRWPLPPFLFPAVRITDDSHLSLSIPIEVVPDGGERTRCTRIPYDPREKFLSFLPHSGFHNQRIAFENALTLARLLNRTLLMPPIRLALGNGGTIGYAPYWDLRRRLRNSGKEGLNHSFSWNIHAYIPDECVSYTLWTHIPWDWLVDLSHIRHHQRTYERYTLDAINMQDSEDWEADMYAERDGDILTLADTTPYDFRFVDTLAPLEPIVPATSPVIHNPKPKPKPPNKYTYGLSISHLARSDARLIRVGTLFGSARLRLRTAESRAVRREIRAGMAFAASRIAGLLSALDTLPPIRPDNDTLNAVGQHAYISAHLRLADGPFFARRKQIVRHAWWDIGIRVLGLSIREMIALERVFGGRKSGVADVKPERNDLRQQRQDEEPDIPVDYMDESELNFFNSSEFPDPVDHNGDDDDDDDDDLLGIFLRTFPCTFFLSEFVGNGGIAGVTGKKEDLINAYDALPLTPFLHPFLDALVAARARAFVGTQGSTFSAFVGDVLWRVEGGGGMHADDEWGIVERG